MKDTLKNPWDINKVEFEVLASFAANSETDLLRVLKDNSFLFYELFSRKYTIQPIFREISLGAKLRCDFAWLNDNSDGPEWVLVEVEKPNMKIFNSNKKPSAALNSAIEQVKTWERYFFENPSERKRIFGAVAKFKFILIAGMDKIGMMKLQSNGETTIILHQILKSAQQKFSKGRFKK